MTHRLTTIVYYKNSVTVPEKIMPATPIFMIEYTYLNSRQEIKFKYAKYEQELLLVVNDNSDIRVDKQQFE